jgi:hypothetical protein
MHCIIKKRKVIKTITIKQKCGFKYKMIEIKVLKTLHP